MEKKNTKNSLEMNLESLEKLIEQISGSNVSLDLSLKLYEEGMSLYEKCHQELISYKEKIQLLQNPKEVLENKNAKLKKIDLTTLK